MLEGFFAPLQAWLFLSNSPKEKMRKRIMQRFSTLIITGYLLVAWNICLPGIAVAEECRLQVEQKCSSCHFATYVCPKLKKKKGAWAWKRTVKSMINHGASFTNAETKQLVSCLSNPDNDLLEICAPKK